MSPRPRISSTYTYVTLPLSLEAYQEIAHKLREAGYDHCFDGQTIDMRGLAVEVEETPRGGDDLTVETMPAGEVKSLTTMERIGRGHFEVRLPGPVPIEAFEQAPAPRAW